MVGRGITMDIYITNLKTKERLRIPLLPQEINGTISNKFATYNILKNGEVKIPSGTALDTYTWNTYFPGKARKQGPYIREWTAPKKCDTFMRHLKAKNGKAVKARLMITETHINLDVYLQSYSPIETGGYGDIKYSVTFIRAKKLTVKKSKKKAKAQKSKPAKPLKNTPANDAPARTEPPKAQTYTVKKGDCLWKIAQKFYGAGAQYTKIYEANKGTIGSNPNRIYSGQVFTIP